MNVCKRRKWSPASCVLFGVLLAASAYGQNVSVVRANSFEIGPFIGASHGLDSTRVMGGGNVTYAINKYILPYVEYSYFPGIPKQTIVGNTTVNFMVPISDIHAGVHIRLRFFRDKRFVPYGVFGAGGLVTGTFSGTATFPTAAGPVTQPISAAGTTASAINGGGGLRYYLGQRYGLRVEAKVYKGFGDLDQTFYKAEFGFFFQLR
jgi:hypothetical protein